MINISMTQKLIIAFVTLIVGVVLVPVIADQGLDRTSKLAISSEPHSMTGLTNTSIIANASVSAKVIENTIFCQVESTLKNVYCSNIVILNESNNFVINSTYGNLTIPATCGGGCGVETNWNTPASINGTNWKMSFTYRYLTDIDELATYTVTNNPTSWKSYDCPLTNFVLRNQSGTPLTVTTDYVLTASTGTYTLKNTTEVNALVGIYNSTYVSYTYCADDYLNSSWGRTVINLVPGFFALALLLFSVGIFFSIGKEVGIL